MKLRLLLFSVLVICSSNGLFAQDYHYSFKVNGAFDQDGSLKEIQSLLRPLFDKLLTYQPVDNTFTVVTEARVTQEMLANWLQEGGYGLISFDSDFVHESRMNLHKQ